MSHSKISWRFSGNSEASASELPENLQEMFPWYYMNIDVISRFKYSSWWEREG